MPTIKVNPDAWQTDVVVVGDATYQQGATYEVDDATWEKLSVMTLERGDREVAAFVAVKKTRK